MFLFIMIMLIIIAAISASIKESAWKQEQIEEDTNNPENVNNMLGTYVDSSGLLRDRYTNKPRTTTFDKNGDRVLYDEKMRPLLNITQELYEKALKEKIKTAKPNDTTVEFTDTEAERFIHDEDYPKWHYLYVDIFTNQRYILITGSSDRGMKDATYYFDYKTNKVIRPTDGFLKYLAKPTDEKPLLMYSSQSHFPNLGEKKESLANNMSNVISEIHALQYDIDEAIKENENIYSFDAQHIRFPEYDKWKREIDNEPIKNLSQSRRERNKTIKANYEKNL